MTEIPEHLKKRAEEARKKAAEGGGLIPEHLLARSKARQAATRPPVDVDYEILNLNGVEYVPMAIFLLVEAERDHYLQLLDEVGIAPDDSGPTFIGGIKPESTEAIAAPTGATVIDFAAIGKGFLDAVDEYRPIINKLLGLGEKKP